MNNSRRGFTLIELSVSLSVIGVLLAITVPAIECVRESARTVQCKVHLHEIGLAIHNFESQNLMLPAGCDVAGGNRHSWCTRLLPYWDQGAIYRNYDWTRAWNDSDGTVNHTNKDLTSRTVSVFLCPSEPNERQGGTDYGGNYGTTLSGMSPSFDIGGGWEAGALVVINTQGSQPRYIPTRWGEFTDGLSQTSLVYECTGLTTEAGNWGNGFNCLAIDYPINSDLNGHTIKSSHAAGGGHVLFADGHVKFLTNGIDVDLLARLATRNRNEAVESEL